MTEFNEFKEKHDAARQAWLDWLNAANALKEAQQEVEFKPDFQKLQAFIAEFKEIKGYRRAAVREYFERVFKSVFNNRRKRTLELGKHAGSEYFKDKRLCISPNGFAMRYEYTTHAQTIRFGEFCELVRKGELPHIIELLQNAKQHELAMNVVQFAKLIENEELFGEGIVADLQQPISVPHEFDRYSRTGTHSLPRIAERVELEEIGEKSVTFNLFTKAEKHENPVQTDYAEDRNEDYKPSRVEVELSAQVQNGRVGWLQMQLWLQIDHLIASMSKSSQEYREKLAAIHKQAEDNFNRYLLVSMLEGDGR